MTFRDRLTTAAQDGLLLGVKWGLVLLAALFAANYVLELRQAALNGQAAYQFLLNAQKAQQARPQPTVTPAPAK